MANTGWTICGTGADDATVGTEAWVNPGNITADDASYADGDLAYKDEQMHYIKGSNFGLSVPSGARIDGIAIRGQFYDALSGDPAYINYARVYHPTSGLGNDLEAGSTDLTATPTDYDYGSSSELHGLSWVSSDVNDSTFAVLFSVNASHNGVNGGNPRCDAIWVDVYYTELSVAADAGSYTLTGQAAGLLVDHVIPAAAGTYTLTGQNVDLSTSANVTMSAAAGSYTLTGQAAGLLRQYPLTASAGSYTLTGQAAGLRYDHKIDASTGSYTLTGQAVDLLKQYSFAAAAGSYTLTGQDAGLRHDFKIDAGAGSYTLTGQAASLLRQYPLTADAGSYALTGQSVLLIQTYPELTADAGAYALTGQDAGLYQHYVVQAGAGAYAITGQSVGLRHDFRIDASAGAYAISGQDVGLKVAHRLYADAGAYALTGQAVGLYRQYPLTAEAGAYTLTGVAALLIQTYPHLQAEAGSYVLTGQSVTMKIDSTFLILTRTDADYALSDTITLERTSAQPGTVFTRTRTPFGLTSEITG